jgi:excisionase family DNA binding protein
MLAGRLIVIDDEVEWAAVAIGLDLLERERRRDGLSLSPKLAALRDKAANYAALARRGAVERGAQQETTPASRRKGPISTLTTKEVATRFGCSSSNITALVRRGRLVASKSSRGFRFDVLDVDELERKRTI